MVNKDFFHLIKDHRTDQTSFSVLHTVFASDKPQLGYSLESADGQDPEKNENIKNVNKSTNLLKLTA